MSAVRPAVPRLFPDETVVCLGCGPSLTADDVEACKGFPVIAIKEAIRLAPWAEILYSSDARWFAYAQADIKSPPRLSYCLEAAAATWATVLEQTGPLGLEESPYGLRTGRSSGYAAINLAVHFGARQIVLLGYDYQLGPRGERNWFGTRAPSYWRAVPPSDPSILQCWPSIVEPLRARGVVVLNASRESSLTMFPRVALEEVA